MLPLKIASQAAMSLGIIAAVTFVLWYLKVNVSYSDHLVYLYLLPVVLIAFLFTGRVAILSAATAIGCTAYFFQDPVYSLYVFNPLERGDLVSFAILSSLAIKCTRALILPASRRSGQ